VKRRVIAADGTMVRDDRLKGAVLYGDTIDGIWYFQLMREGTSIADFRKRILFVQHDLGDAGHGDETRVMALPDSAEICGCNGVCKGDIVKSITRLGLFTLEDVRAHTKASSSCTGLVEALQTDPTARAGGGARRHYQACAP
jgi:nitrite reductase (NADH) large subunit